MQVEDSATRVCHHHEYIEKAKGRRHYDAGIAGNHDIGVIAHKGPPALAGDALVPTGELGAWACISVRCVVTRASRA
jgi:hypothetical protein